MRFRSKPGWSEPAHRSPGDRCCFDGALELRSNTSLISRWALPTSADVLRIVLGWQITSGALLKCARAHVDLHSSHKILTPP
uniref:Uncharacterized protein n=1 Tax=Ascaris lumbricoides TaxID=6252 RepID=A0A0M3HTZ6_ASCLU